MNPVEAICCSDLGPLCRWCSRFSIPPSSISAAEKKPAIDIAAEVDATDEPIEFFMRDNEEPWNCSSRVIYVQDFCDGDRFGERKAPTQLPLVALVEEIHTNRDAAESQPDSSALNAEQLLRYLSDTEVGCTY